MTQIIQSNRTVLKGIYTALMGILLLGYLYMMVTYTHFEAYHIPVLIRILQLVSAVLAVLLGRLRKDKGYRILALYLLWIVLRTVISAAGDLFTERFSESILTGLWAFTACYGFAGILTKEELKSFLRIFVAIWTLLMTVSSCVGIYAAWQDHRIYTTGNAAFWGIYPIRLMMPFLPTVSGAVVSVTALIALCALACEKHGICRIFYGICMIPQLLALSLTDSRTAFLSFSAGAAVLAFICVRRKQSKGQGADSGSGSGREKLIAFAASLLVLAVSVALLVYAEKGFHTLRQRGGLLISRAIAETAEQAAGGRGFSGGSEALTGRTELWIGIFRYLKQHPLVLFFGEGKTRPMAGISALLGYSMAHCHNMLLMILVESGIPGLLLVIAFAVRACRKVIRRIGSEELFPLLPVAIVISILTGDLAECFTWMASGNIPTLAFLMVAVGILCRDEQDQDKALDKKTENGKD